MLLYRGRFASGACVIVVRTVPARRRRGIYLREFVRKSYIFDHRHYAYCVYHKYTSTRVHSRTLVYNIVI